MTRHNEQSSWQGACRLDSHPLSAITHGVPTDSSLVSGSHSASLSIRQNSESFPSNLSPPPHTGQALSPSDAQLGILSEKWLTYYVRCGGGGYPGPPRKPVSSTSLGRGEAKGRPQWGHSQGLAYPGMQIRPAAALTPHGELPADLAVSPSVVSL